MEKWTGMIFAIVDNPHCRRMYLVIHGCAELVWRCPWARIYTLLVSSRDPITSSDGIVGDKFYGIHISTWSVSQVHSANTRLGWY